ncbi:MAG TPA: beta-propeller domain-containing protein [Thermoleophilaceae bacterium]|nr:beta-propeller domain-containing protein [Thermoleophilaceae bacterium]
MTARLLAIVLSAAILVIPATGAQGASKAKPRAFSSCAAIGDYARKHAKRIVGPRGLPVRFGFAVAESRDGGSPPPMATPQEGGVRDGTVDYSTTNVQEEGVDEPDLVKTNGTHLYAITNGTLHVFDVRSGEPKLVGSLGLRGFGHELLLSGDRVLALTTYWNDKVLQPPPEPQPDPNDGAFAPYPYYYAEPATRMFEIDVSDPAAPRLLNSLTVEGGYVSARMRDSVARVVVSTPPSPWAIPTDGSESADEAVRRQRRAIRRSKLSTWMPDAVLRDRVRKTRRLRRVVACDDVRRPTGFSGPGMLTVLTLDLAKGLKPLDSDSLMTDAQTIYASKRSLFVATERWLDPTADDPERAVEPGRFTAIHKFAIGDPESAEYRASGQVRGFVLNQFALSAREGVLRVATTDQPPWRAGAEQRESESFVTTLDEEGGALSEIGRVGGLGKGERIYAVRFIEDVGYVVTFRQVDPLYTVDISDPQKPVVRGELKIPGFSSYLHPVGDGLLLGIGQDATDGGQTQGTQLSLFDVSDLDAPKRLHQETLGDSTGSAAEYDHHAFLYWPPTKLTVVPLSDYAFDDPFEGAVGFSVDAGTGFTELGRVEHDAGGDEYGAAAVLRTVVAGGHVFTVSGLGVMGSELDTLAPVAFTPFPASG